mgnify:CR=1 FL=1|jgi:ribosomal protein L35
MTKMKTKKSIAKRFKIKKSKKGTKVIKRTDGQGHFNSREKSKVTRNKRSDNTMSAKSIKKTIVRALS